MRLRFIPRKLPPRRINNRKSSNFSLQPLRRPKRLSVMMDNIDLVLVLGVLAVPTGLLAAVSITAWGYRRSLARSMSRSSAGAEFSAADVRLDQAPSRGRDLIVRLIEPRDVRPESVSVEDEAAGAAELTRQFRVAHVAAVVTYSVIANTAFLLAQRTTTMPFDVGVTIFFLLVAPEILIIIGFFSYSVKIRLSVLVAYALAGFVLAAILANQSRLKLLPILFPIYALYPIAGVFLLLMKRLQPLLIMMVAVLLFQLIGAAIVIWFSPALNISQARPWVFAAGFVNVVLGVIIFGWLLRHRSVIGPVIALAALAGLGIIADKVLWPDQLIGAMMLGVPLNILQVLIVWLIFKGFVRLQDRSMLTTELLHSHLCCGWLTCYLTILAFNSAPFSGDAAWLPWTLAGAFLCYVAVLHISLRRIRAQRIGQPGKRLLLLRVFGNAEKRERLLDLLDDTWRRIGRVDLITGLDLAMRGLASITLEAFLLRRLDGEFLKTRDEVDLRLENLRCQIEGDLRFPVNSVNCYANAWQHAVTRLASSSDAVLLDLRGFTRTNEGCVFELTYLIRHIALRHCLMLVDCTTDMSSLQKVAQAAWASLPVDSPNAQEPTPEILTLKLEKLSGVAMRALFLLLLRAASRTPCAERNTPDTSLNPSIGIHSRHAL
jgi:hypothetical protein